MFRNVREVAVLLWGSDKD